MGSHTAEITRVLDSADWPSECTSQLGRKRDLEKSCNYSSARFVHSHYLDCELPDNAARLCCAWQGISFECNLCVARFDRRGNSECASFLRGAYGDHGSLGLAVARDCVPRVWISLAQKVGDFAIWKSG